LGRHEYSAERLEAGGPPGSEDTGGDGAEAEPSERDEGQQVRQRVAARMQDAPQGKHEQDGRRGWQEQMPPGPELVPELGWWCLG